MIEVPTDSQKHTAAIAYGAQLLANGRSTRSVVSQLERRGMSVSDIEDSWLEMLKIKDQLLRSRKRRVLTMGIIWFSLGFSMLAGMVYFIIFYDRIPFILFLGMMPLAYGIYLFRLPATENPSIEPPCFFGRNI